MGGGHGGGSSGAQQRGHYLIAPQEQQGQELPRRLPVVFNQEVSSCSFQASLGSVDSQNPAVSDVGVALRDGNPDAVYVRTTNQKGIGADEGFHLEVVC